MTTDTAAVAGASGYAGGEVLRLLGARSTLEGAAISWCSI